MNYRAMYDGDLFDLLVNEIKLSLPDIGLETIRTWIQAFFGSVGVHPSLRGFAGLSVYLPISQSQFLSTRLYQS